MEAETLLTVLPLYEETKSTADLNDSFLRYLLFNYVPLRLRRKESAIEPSWFAGERGDGSRL
jgi:hypothetical protein